ncbi:protein of unknown function [Kyrpidia spormannii]|uniref:Uncharacterized protein n=2 Tax=Kyrpidia spormannii TaxID=2055160 RepID=A0ACA8Z7X1_9BACL|nr:protein of unknown function [Kyrpidia spormannii]CAB3392177.1 protein of unknown function [Kyrpidia spormannii]
MTPLLELEDVLPSELIKELREANQIRKFPAHYFWFERAHLMFSVPDVLQLLAELDVYAKLFEHLDAIISGRLAAKRKEFGFSDEFLQHAKNLVLAGMVEPLPSKQIIVNLQNKLRKLQRLIRVWEVTVNGGGETLVFELSDRSLW